MSKKTTSQKRQATSLLSKINTNWKAWAIIGGIIGVSIFSWNYAMGQVEATAQKAVDARINKAMIDGAKEATSQAVKEQLPAISKQAAKDVVEELKSQQMIQPPPQKVAADKK